MRRRTVYVRQDNSDLRITAGAVLIIASIAVYVIMHFWWVFVVIGLLCLSAWLVSRSVTRFREIEQARRDEHQRIIDRMQHENAAYNNDSQAYIRNIQNQQRRSN